MRLKFNRECSPCLVLIAVGFSLDIVFYYRLGPAESPVFFIYLFIYCFEVQDLHDLKKELRQQMNTLVLQPESSYIILQLPLWWIFFLQRYRFEQGTTSNESQ